MLYYPLEKKLAKGGAEPPVSKPNFKYIAIFNNKKMIAEVKKKRSYCTINQFSLGYQVQIYLKR